jgi:hypothetical protein
MRSSLRLTALLVSVSVLLSGCATMRYPTVYKVEGKEFKEFKELDDDKVIKIIVQIYNVKFEGAEDNVARSIALEEYLALAKKRHSAYIKKSGVFDLQYDKVKLPSWKNEDLEKLYDSLIPKARLFYMDSASELTEIQNANRVIYLTAVNAVIKELRKRRDTENAMEIASRVLVGVLSIALSMI